MKFAVFLILCFIGQSLLAAEPMKKAGQPPLLLPQQKRLTGTSVHLDRIVVLDLLTFVVTDLAGKSFVVDPEALKVVENERVSMHLDAVTEGRALELLQQLLKPLDLVLHEEKGVYVVKRVDRESVFVYRPRFRSAQYLRELGAIVAPTGQFGGKSGGFSPASGTSSASPSASSAKQATAAASATTGNDNGNKAGINALAESSSDVVVFVGPKVEVSRLQLLFAQLDVVLPQVSIKGALYEVGTTTKDGSAVQLVLSLLSKRASVSVGGSPKAGEAVSFATGDFTGFISALSADSRFKVLSQPSLTVASGASAVLTVGQDVPVLAAIESNGTGTSRQSVEYRSSGVILSIKPDVREDRIDLTVDQQLSGFVQTDSGVNSSPTLNRRQIKTVVQSKSDDVIVIGGLRDDKDTSAASGLSFLPSWLRSASREVDSSELVLVLHVTKL